MSTFETFRAKVVVEERRRRKAGNILIDALAGEDPPFPMTEEEEGEQERVEGQNRHQLGEVGRCNGCDHLTHNVLPNTCFRTLSHLVLYDYASFQRLRVQYRLRVPYRLHVPLLSQSILGLGLFPRAPPYINLPCCYYKKATCHLHCRKHMHPDGVLSH